MIVRPFGGPECYPGADVRFTQPFPTCSFLCLFLYLFVCLCLVFDIVLVIRI